MSIAELIQKSGVKRLIPDKMYLAIKYRKHFGYWMSFRNPKTFCEKLQWLKIYDRRSEYSTMVDKYAVKKYVADIIGEEYVIPTLGVWEKGEDIEWDKLPNSFVLKCTHDSGGLVICRDKSKLDKEKTIRKLNRCLKQDFYVLGREWPYKNVKKRIIAEKFMAERTVDGKVIDKDLVDYKFFCFDGEPEYCQVIRNRNTKETIDFYDMEWNHMPFVGLNPVANNGDTPVAKPIHLDKLIEICRKLSKDLSFARVDLYVINDKEYFGEITFFPASGLGCFTPDEWNYKLGDLLKLSNKRNN